MRRFFILTALVVLLAGECSPKVAPTTLRHLADSADLIVIGKVTRVIEVKGLRVAEVQVAANIKGHAPNTIYYLAQPTWICDTTTATLGKETLFFFTEYRFDSQPASMAFVRPGGNAGTYTPKDDASPVAAFSGPFTAFKEPTGFREQIKEFVGVGHFWQVSWSGRGQMPISTIQGTKYATLWVGDVRLPDGISTVRGPQREYNFIRSAPLKAIIDFVEKQPTSVAH